ncbi:MAG: MnhB domain-containing protein [Defluviitaleaceae bacterium]|nr:MnhB domain-containing protein [Defluviitaleaceae bacterium]
MPVKCVPKKCKLYREMKSLKANPMILRAVVGPLTPFTMIYGIYILFNGHLSPGGGFSGGTILGTGLVLSSIAYGSEKVNQFFTPRVLMAVCCAALAFYSILKVWKFMVGATGGSMGIPLGTPGAILSGGTILPLNISIGLVVAVTIYNFYSLFAEGEV